MSSKYFVSRKLNYTFVNEDHVVESELLPVGAKHAMVVAGSGTRLVPLMARAPKKITLVDISQEQILLSRFRLDGIRSLSREDFMSLWGYAGVTPITPAERREIFLGMNISLPEVRTFFQSVLEENQWGPLLPLGRWENTFRSISRIAAKVLGQGVIDSLFAIRSLQEHRDYLERSFPWWRWEILIALVSNSMFFNLMLYGREFPRMNVADGFRSFYHEALKASLLQCPARENFFIQILFLGEVRYSEGLPLDTRPDLFAAAKKSNTEVEFRCGNLLEEIAKASPRADFVAVSDVPSYFNGDAARLWLRNVRSGMADGGLMVARYYRHVPEGVDMGGWHNLNHRYQELFERELTHMYRYDILQKME